MPLPVLCAIERFRDWERSTPAPSPEAREEAVIQMIHLYRLDRFPEAFRYLVYQRTYFQHASTRTCTTSSTVHRRGGSARPARAATTSRNSPSCRR